MKRVSHNAGNFYPNSIKALKNSISSYNKTLDMREDTDSILNLKPKAIISPLYKYEYCGYSMNLAHRVLANNRVRRVVVIGSSQNTEFKGISGSFFNYYQTPIKDIVIDIEYLNIIDKNFGLEFIQEAHFLEYSTENQMPFIAHYQPDTEVIELIYGEDSKDKLSKIITWLLKDSLTSIVVCSDLSHFYTKEQAKMLDSICLNGIAQIDNNILDKGCESCGIVGIKALNNAVKTLNMQNLILDYNTSECSSNKKEKSNIIGYTSVAYW